LSPSLKKKQRKQNLRTMQCRSFHPTFEPCTFLPTQGVSIDLSSFCHDIWPVRIDTVYFLGDYQVQ
jgi:hypothetical protein